MASISVIIPAYNRAGLIGETIRSVLAQTVSAREIIVVDDGSTDGTAEAAIRAAERCKPPPGAALPDFRVIRQPNAGPGAARNRGLEAAKGDFIWFMDSDDLASVNRIEAQLDALIRTGADIVLSPWARVKISDARTVMFQGPVLQQDMPPSRIPLLFWLCRGWSVVFQALTIRRSLLDGVGPFREDMRSCQDSEYFARILFASSSVTFAGDCLTLYRIHDQGNITPRREGCSPGRARDWAEHVIALGRLLDAHGQRPDLETRLGLSVCAYRALRDLELSGATQRDCAERLSLMLKEPKWVDRTISRLLEIRGGLQQRMTGNRWCGAYCATPATAAQRRLVRQMGFECAN